MGDIYPCSLLMDRLPIQILFPNTKCLLFPLGTQRSYQENESGLILSLSELSLSWLDGNTEREIPLTDNGFSAQYVRVYMNGNTKNSCNHIKELEVFAK